MAWPDDEILDIKVEAAFNDQWTDITEYVYKESVKIARGVDDEAVDARPSEVNFLLNNADGRFSPRNPKGPYYGQFRRNTGLLVSVMGGDRYLDVPGAGRARVLDTAQIDITGDIDVRFDATLYNWMNDGETIETIAKYDVTGNQRSWAVLVAEGTIQWRWSEDGTVVQASVATEKITTPANDRLAIRVTHDVNNGASGNTVTFYTAPTIEGPWTQLGDPVVDSGTTSIFNSTAQLAVGDAMEDVAFDRPRGKIWAAQVYNGINGTIAADVDFRVQTVGDTSFTDDAGLTWETESSAHINNQHNRFRGEVTAWPSKWTTGGRDVWVPLRGRGLKRRHNQGTKPLESTLARRIPSAPELVAYWPLEVGEDATQAGAKTPNTRAIQFIGDVDPHSHEGPHGSDTLPSFNAQSSWFAPIPAMSSGEYQIEWIVNIRQVTSTYRTIMQLGTTGTIAKWKFQVRNDGAMIRGYLRDGSLSVEQGVSLDMTEHINHWVRWRFEASTDGLNVDWVATWIPIGGAGGEFSGTYSGTVGRASAISGVDGLSSDIEGLAWGHLAVFDSIGVTIFNSADHGFTGEDAISRFERLCDEAGERYILSGCRDDVPDMGAQRPDKLVDLLSETATADRGFMLDGRDWADFNAFKFVSKNALYNQAPVLTLDYGGSDGLVTPMEPVDDDLYLKNAVTAIRERGSQEYVELEEGDLTPARVGLYDTSRTVNIDSDHELVHIAGWELHLGSWNEERYPSINLKLQAAPHLIADVLNLDVGSRIRITNARSSSDNDWIPPGDLELIVRGYREEMAQYVWEFEFQCIPARPWDIVLLDNLAQAWNHVDTDSSELAEALTETETGVELFTNSGPTWTDDIEDMPYQLTVGGEVVTVIAPGELITSNSLFDSATTGWTAQNSSIAHSTAVVHPDPRALGSLEITPDGVSATGGAMSAMTSAGTVQPGSRIVCSMWVYSAGGLSDIRPTLEWYDSAGSLLSQPTGSSFTAPAREWTYMEQEFTAPASSSRIKMRVRHGSTPAASPYYVWAAISNRPLASKVFDEFGRTLTDSWGSADSMQTWQTSGGTSADYDVLSGYGAHTLATTNVSRRSFIDQTYADVDARVDIAVSATATGGFLSGSLTARHTDSDNMYMARVAFETTGAITLTVRERVAGAETQLGTFTHHRTYSAGTFFRVRFQVIGSALKAKVWRVGDPEPRWQIEVTDTSHAATSYIGLRSISSSANTNVNPQVRYQNLRLENPQAYTVVRSENDVVKTHDSGDSVSLTYPMILAL